MDEFKYERSQVERVLRSGPNGGSGKYHLKIEGAQSTKWLLVDREALIALIEFFEGEL